MTSKHQYETSLIRSACGLYFQGHLRLFYQEFLLHRCTAGSITTQNWFICSLLCTDRHSFSGGYTYVPWSFLYNFSVLSVCGWRAWESRFRDCIGSHFWRWFHKTLNLKLYVTSLEHYLYRGGCRISWWGGGGGGTTKKSWGGGRNKTGKWKNNFLKTKKKIEQQEKLFA